MVIFVLGTHRSGSSCVAGVLHRLGVPMGKRLMKATDFNPDGHFEDEEFVALNKAILGETGDDPRIHDDRWQFPVPRPEAHLSACRALIEVREQAGPIWGVKDPRFCYTLPAFLGVLRDVPARFVHVHRPWRESAASLYTRERARNPQFNVPKAELVARRYYDQLATLLPLAAATGPVLTVDFSWVIAHSLEATHVLHAFAQSDLPGSPAQFEDAMASIDPALKHWYPQ